MPFGGLVEVAIARSNRPAGGTRETIRVAGPQTTKFGSGEHGTTANYGGAL
jgi:hypothetical protein